MLSACATAPRESEQDLARTLVALGIGYMKRGDKAVALEKLKKAIEVDPGLPSAHHAIALLYAELGEKEKAEAHFRRALSLAPDDGEAHNDYGVFLCRQGRVREGVKHFEKAVANPLYPTPALAYVNAGLCLFKKDPAAAEGYFRKALEYDPRQPSALYHLAVLNFEKKRYLKARAYLQRYEEVAPHTRESLWLAERIERALGDEEAAARYHRLLRSLGNSTSREDHERFKSGTVRNQSP
ncbi:MAG: type IV pilus biogenesis/stability protein PilW [Gammaproteobacteria bacterium]|nr:MAG: type IV pilus biogenesis/stability protein PilW [Gammaproteobacteria bacterium]